MYTTRKLITGETALSTMPVVIPASERQSLKVSLVVYFHLCFIGAKTLHRSFIAELIGAFGLRIAAFTRRSPCGDNLVARSVSAALGLCAFSRRPLESALRARAQRHARGVGSRGRQRSGGQLQLQLGRRARPPTQRRRRARARALLWQQTGGPRAGHRAPRRRRAACLPTRRSVGVCNTRLGLQSGGHRQLASVLIRFPVRSRRVRPFVSVERMLIHCLFGEYSVLG